MEKQNKFLSSSFSRISIYFSLEESIKDIVIINGKLLWTIIGGIRFISIAPWIWELVFLMKVNLLFPFVRNELVFIFSLSFNVFIVIRADQFWYLVLKSVICCFLYTDSSSKTYRSKLMSLVLPAAINESISSSSIILT